MNVQAMLNEAGTNEQIHHILRERSRQAWVIGKKKDSIIILSFEDQHMTNWNLHSLSAKLHMGIPQLERPTKLIASS